MKKFLEIQQQSGQIQNEGIPIDEEEVVASAKFILDEVVRKFETILDQGQLRKFETIT